jgi:hypothetical protein
MINRTRSRSIFYILLLLPVVVLAGAKATHADAGGHFLIPELPSGVMIDPTDCSDSDWPADFLSFDIESVTNPGTVLGSGQMVISHPADLTAPDGEELYLYIEMSADTVVNNDDQVVLMFDNSHDHAAPDTTSYDASDDRGILFRRDESITRVFGLLTNPQEEVGQTAFDPNRGCIGPAGAGWNIEATILPSDLGLNSFAALAGAAVLAQDGDGGANPVGTWPDTNTAVHANWVNLVSRTPIDYILVIDQSGSMFGDKWDSVNQAGDNFALILSVLKDDDLDAEYAALTMDGDQLGLVTFTTAHGSPGAATDIALSTIPANPADYISDVLPASPSGGTPMIDGVRQAINEMGGAANILADPLGRSRVIMFLSDGLHNTPSTTFTPASDYLPMTCSSNSPLQIHTVAVGTDTTVDTGKLDALKDCFAGNIGPDGASSATTIYNITGTGGLTGPQLAARLTKFFVETILPEYRLNLLTETGANFTIKAGERNLLLFAFWPTTGPGISLSITDPDSNVESGECEEDLGYCYLLLENPIAGTYTNFNAPGAVADGRFVLLDLRTEARFGIDNRPHGTSSDITLRAKLREDGLPILGADVRVDIARPEEGFGTFIVTHDLRCNSIEPQPPSADLLLQMISQPGTTFPSPVGHIKSPRYLAKVAAAQDFPDVPADHFLLMEQLLEVCQKDDLERAEDSGLQLYDDGSHGDSEADDGIYTLSFTNTEIEGSYVFRFRADGTTSDSQSFGRIKEVAEYIRLDVDPAQTSFGSLVLQQEGNLVWQAHYVLPQSAAGEYLGPGYVHQVDFTTTGGLWVGPVRDLGNGYYFRILQYDESQGVPEVTPVVQGQPIQPDSLVPEWLCLWLILLLLIIILLLLLYILRLRRKK